MKLMKKRNVAIALLLVCSLICISFPSLAATTRGFSFCFSNYNNQNYATTWSKGTNNSYYEITLSRKYNSEGSTMGKSNIFGCKLKDMSISPAADVYHTFSNYVSDYGIDYQTPLVSYGDIMQFTGKKDSSSTSNAALKISGTIKP